MEALPEVITWSLLDILTLLAIFTGPIIAIMISRYLDGRREMRARKLDVFRTLMRTRRTPVLPEHVGALNLIEIEFQDNEKVLGAWRELLRHFASTHPRRPEEELTNQLDQPETRTRNERFHVRLAQERQTLLAKLLHSIGKEIGFKAEQLDIFEGGYTPQGWGDDEWEGRALRRVALELLTGDRFLPVGVVDYSQPQTSSQQEEPSGMIEHSETNSGQPLGDRAASPDIRE